MTRSKVVIPCFFTLLSLSPMCSARRASIDNAKGPLAGKVLFAVNEQPAWHARVELKPEAGQHTERAHTNRKGEFSFAKLAYGTYFLTANAPNCAITREEIHFEPGSDALLVRLERSKTADTISVHELAAPSEASADFNEGLRRLALGDLNGSISEFRRATKEYPSYFEAYDKLGVAELQAHLDTAAEWDLRKSIALSDRHYAEPFFALGMLLCENEKNYADAEGDIREGLDLTPYDPAGRFALAWLLYRTDRLSEAEENAREAASDAPEASIVYVLLAEIHLRQKNKVALVEDVNHYLKLDPDGSFAVKARIAKAQALRDLATLNPAAVASTRP